MAPRGALQGAEVLRPPPTARQMVHDASRARLPRRAARPEQTLDAILLARGAVCLADLSKARLAAQGLDIPLGDVLLAQGAITEAELLPALADIHGMGLADLDNRTTDPRVTAYLPVAAALALDAVPVKRAGNVLVVATSRPDRAAEIRAALCLPEGVRAILTLAPRGRIIAAQIARYGDGLARLAEGQAPRRHSCRTWRPDTAARRLALGAAGLAWLAFALPSVAVAGLFGLAIIIFLGNMILKMAAFAATLRAERQAGATANDGAQRSALPLRLPVVSILVPLYHEPEIATTLIARLARLEYPRERLDILLIVEEDDRMTRTALRAAPLPAWIRVITVPQGSPRTKPRALNFALNFTRGEIIGIYDAEDRPEADQIARVVDRFATTGPDVACLQGRLDYYNARHNVLSRLFAIEYASWFRVLLPGVERLGLVVPLGGTTLFLRRAALSEVGGWDAHNVTEDAELGLRLARHGYRTEIVETTTFEEANAAVLPWIRQRSRWQKGYLLTWAIAMRDPRALWRDLGAIRFLALQVQILFAVAGFLVAPLLWSLMVKPFGLPHPLDSVVGPLGYGALATGFVASFVLTLALAFHATRAPHLRALRLSIPLAELYFLLATVSAWRAAAEMLLRPFWWAKTSHGSFGGVSGSSLTTLAPAPLPSTAPRRRSTGDP
jgi:cellulose synthase/poly-beta-1,6-N-acetylglucosamine synthase-like glycosyltransferase